MSPGPLDLSFPPTHQAVITLDLPLFSDGGWLVRPPIRRKIEPPRAASPDEHRMSLIASARQQWLANPRRDLLAGTASPSP